MCDGVVLQCRSYSVAPTVSLHTLFHTVSTQCRSIHCFTLTPSRKYLDSSSSNSLLHTLHSRQSIGWIPHVIPETPSSNHSHCSCYPCSSHLCSHRVIPHTQVLSLNTHTARVIPDTLTQLPTTTHSQVISLTVLSLTLLVFSSCYPSHTSSMTELSHMFPPTHTLTDCSLTECSL